MFKLSRLEQNLKNIKELMSRDGFSEDEPSFGEELEKLHTYIVFLRSKAIANCCEVDYKGWLKPLRDSGYGGTPKTDT